MELHRKDPMTLGRGLQASSYSYILSREEPRSPGEEFNNATSFYDFNLGILLRDSVVKCRKEELKQKQTRD